MSKEEVILPKLIKKNQQVFDEWINNNRSVLAIRRIKRTGIINDINERDNNKKYKRSLKEKKELVVVKDNLANEINFFRMKNNNIIA